MMAYRTAIRLFPGCHLPLVYLGMEYTKSGNVNMGEQYLQLARSVCSTDPLVSNELGTLRFKQQR
jgi:anaphase-promoting complex subunit 6